MITSVPSLTSRVTARIFPVDSCITNVSRQSCNIYKTLKVFALKKLCLACIQVEISGVLDSPDPGEAFLDAFKVKKVIQNTTKAI